MSFRRILWVAFIVVCVRSYMFAIYFVPYDPMVTLSLVIVGGVAHVIADAVEPPHEA